MDGGEVPWVVEPPKQREGGDPLIEEFVNIVNSPKLLQDFMGLNGSVFLMGLEIR